MKTKGKTVLKTCFIVVFLLAALLPLFLNFSAVRSGTLDLYGTFWSLVPPIIAIGLALITKEVYTSLFVGILFGALYYTSFNPMNTLLALIGNTDEGLGIIGSLGDGWNIGILIFLVILGIIVALMNKAGGSAAFGKWAGQRIKSRTGAQLSTFLLGVLIFVDDYFNCLTVGSVMMPVTDKHKISRAKLAYLIDATAAPVCIIAPISSWAAAVTSYAPEGEGIMMFVRTIPFNYYALFTLAMIIVISILKIDFGPMKRYEKLATEEDDLFGGTGNEYTHGLDTTVNENGKMIDLLIPVIVLIICCIAGMIYTGGFFDPTSGGYLNFIVGFSDSDASVGLSMGSLVALVIIFVYFMIRRTLSFKEFSDCLPDGFRQMVPAIMILIFAWTLSGFVRSGLGAATFVENNLQGAAASFASFLPAIFFLIACGIAFATGTSWGTFGILIPLALAVFPDPSTIQIISISACLAGAVMGDHCSPISDTTIMSSTGAQCNHIQHVSTQMPYALLVAGISFVTYIIAGLVQNVWLPLLAGFVLLFAILIGIKALQKKS